MDNTRWVGISTNVSEEVVKKIRQKLQRLKKKALPYKEFCGLLATEGNLSPVAVMGAITIFRQEDTPNPARHHLFRKYEKVEKDRCCFVRNPTDEELAAYEPPQEAADVAIASI